MADDRNVFERGWDWLTGDDEPQRPPARQQSRPPANQDNRTFAQRFSDWWNAPKTPPKPFIDPKTGKPLPTKGPVDPRTGRRTGAPAGSMGVTDYLANFWENSGIDRSMEAAREFIKSIPNTPREVGEGLMALTSAYRGLVGSGMSDRQYYDLLMKARTGDPMKDAYLDDDFGGKQPTAEQMRRIRQQDQAAAVGLANQYTYRDPKTGELKFDVTSQLREGAQDPAGTGVAILQAIRSGGTSLGRTALERSALHLPGTATERALRRSGQALNLVGKTAGAASWVANPLVPGTVALARSAPVRAGITAARRTVSGRKPVYSAEFLKEWNPYKKQYEDYLRETGGMSKEQIDSPEVQRQIYNEFQQGTGGRFADPFKPEISAAMRQNGMDPVQYGLPDRAKILETTIYKKGGVSPAILREAEMKVGGADNVTFSAATGEPPSRLFGGNEQNARAATEAQMSGALSGQFAAPQGASIPTLQDVTDDFIRSNVERRNAAQADYNAAARNDGVYQDPNAFIGALDQQIADNLRARGIDPRELSTNSEAFGSANTVSASLRRNISNHGSFVQPIQGLGADGRMYTYNRDSGGWFDPNGNPAAPGQTSFLNQTTDLQAQLASPTPTPVNKLSLGNLEIERRNLNAAAEQAYQRAVKGNGDFREYNAITAMRDAIDDTAINMADSFTGDARAAIPRLQSARSNYRDWRTNGIDSPNPVVRQGAQAIESRTVFDPQTSQYQFSDAAGARQAVNNTFEGKLIGSGQSGIAPPRSIGSGADATNPAEVFTALQRSMSPQGRDTLTGYVRGQGYGAQGASPAELAQFDAAYRGNGIELLSPEERDFFNINMRGRSYTDPTQIPQNDPFSFNPFSEVNRSKGITTPLRNAAVGALTGTTMGGGPVSGAIGGAFGLFGGPSLQEFGKASNWARQQAGAPNYLPNVPDFNLPLAAGVAATQPSPEQVEDQMNKRGAQVFGAPQQPAAQGMQPPAPAPTPTPVAAPKPRVFNRPAADEGLDARGAEFFGSQDDINRRGAEFFGSFEPRKAGGRAAYKSGGAVTDIEPLVRKLMNRAAQAKKMTNKDTEVLLNSHDDAIASALEVAQKSI